MNDIATARHTAFAGSRQIASGAPAGVAIVVKRALEADEGQSVLVFEDETGRPVELDLRGGEGDARPGPDLPAALAPRTGAGRPKLGVVAREVTLLPRHWDWLAQQPGGASAALRRLVEGARRDLAAVDRARQSHTALYKVMTVLAGDAPGYEEATRALFAHDYETLDGRIAGWPPDVGAYLRRLAMTARADAAAVAATTP
jgi:hypothetical protein